MLRPTSIWALLFAFLVFAQGNGTAQTVERFDTCNGLGGSAVADSHAKSANELEEAALEFATKNGISVSFAQNRFVFTLKAGGDIELFSTPGTKDGLNSAKTQLKALVDAKVKKISATFDVEFATEAEVIDKQWVKNDKGEWSQDKDVLCRAPRLNELYGIEAALYRAQPSQKGENGGKGLKFYFLTDDLTRGERPLASWRGDRNGRPAIHYYIGSCDGRPVLERDAPFNPKAKLGHSYGSIEALTLHEISHNHQNNIGWWTDLQKDEAAKFGFRDCGVDGDGNRIWAVKSTRKDSNGAHIYYRLNDKTSEYFPCDETGKTIAGEPEISKSELRKIAAHRPMTYYFPNPSETYAEGVMVYRLGGVYRASLLKENPGLYEVVKRLDQNEIDNAYGRDVQYEWRQGFDQWGNQVHYQVEVSRTSRYIRNADGNVVANTRKNAVAVNDFEKKSR
ncbi:MAG: hypothetical protein K2W95_16070 [Candidatus Obscuribacterales bacterium]|nr:hypothetical protein [Candidatus Obscuribacterales bacterium]